MQQQNNERQSLYVKFYSEPIQNNFLSEKEGRPVFDDVDLVKIHIPGDTTLCPVSLVNADHKQRFPIEWAHYLNNKNLDAPISGTPVKQWGLLTPAQAEELKRLNFHTVEMVANASDVQLQNLRMVAGMSPSALRDKAGVFLRVSKDAAIVNAAQERVQALEEEKAKTDALHNAEMAEMQEKLNMILANMAQKEAVAPEEPKRGPGRPAKNEG